MLTSPPNSPGFQHPVPTTQRISFRGLTPLAVGLAAVISACGSDVVDIPAPPGFGEAPGGPRWQPEDLRILLVAQPDPTQSEMIFVEGTTFRDIPIGLGDETRLFLTPSLVDPEGSAVEFAAETSAPHPIGLFCDCFPRDDCELFSSAPVWLWSGGDSWEQYTEAALDAGVRLIEEVCPAMSGNCPDIVRVNDETCPIEG